jgi:superfamily II DNA or RNA helicase
MNNITLLKKNILSYKNFPPDFKKEFLDNLNYENNIKELIPKLSSKSIDNYINSIQQKYNLGWTTFQILDFYNFHSSLVQFIILYYEFNINDSLNDISLNDISLNDNPLNDNPLNYNQLNKNKNDITLNDIPLNDIPLNDNPLNDNPLNENTNNNLLNVNTNVISLNKSKNDIPLNDIQLDENKNDIPLNNIPLNNIPLNENTNENPLNTNPYKINLDLTQDYESNKFTLNKSQQLVYDYYQQNGIQTGLICNATGTGKTNCIFMTIGWISETIEIIFILCHYKNIIKQMFYNEYNEFDYKKFRELKTSNIIDIWDYEIYDLTIERTRNEILNNIETIKKSTNKKIFLINPQYISNNKTRYKLLPKPTRLIHDEAHSITGKNTYNFLKYFKKQNCKIIGLTATPIRNIKKQDNYDILQDIYSVNENINIISNYEIIKAITDKEILNIEIYWYECFLDGTNKENKLNITNIENCIECINKILNVLPNKKILIWCGTISHAIKMKIEILKKINNINVYIDHSKTEQDDSQDFIKFQESEFGILVCADKHREGSDIRYLDCIVFADLVKKKNELPFIQCLGRVQRKSNILDKNQKTVGYVIDSYDISHDIEKKTTDIINKLIYYYYDFFSRTLDKNITRHENILEQYKDIIERYSFIRYIDENLIMIKLNDELNIKIHCNLENINFDNVRKQFKIIITEHIIKEYNLTELEELEFNYKKFRLDNKKYGIKTNDEYIEKINVYNYIENPEIYYQNIWKGWYDYLGIDASKYTLTFDEFENILQKLELNTAKQYYKNALEYGLPLMIKEIYPSFNKF